MNVEKLIENLEELGELARLTECKTVLPVSELRKEFERSAVRYAPKLGMQIQKAWSKGKLEEVVLVTGGVGLVWLGATGIDAYKNARAKKKAEETLLPVYKEIATKVMGLTTQVTSMLEQQQNLIEEQMRQGKDNTAKIEKLSKDIKAANAIIKRFEHLRNGGE